MVSPQFCKHFSDFLKLIAFGNDIFFVPTDFLDLTLEDVGGCIELVYTPVRKDGLKGSPKSILSAVIIPGEFFLHAFKIAIFNILVVALTTIGELSFGRAPHLNPRHGQVCRKMIKCKISNFSLLQCQAVLHCKMSKSSFDKLYGGYYHFLNLQNHHVYCYLRHFGGKEI